MNGNNTRGIRNVGDDGRALPYRFVGDNWFGGWTRRAASDGGITINADGTDGDDVFVGTEAKDEYHGLRGNDTISGEGGNDLLFGDEGVDTINGGIGDDRLYGGNGADMIDGGDGNDSISGGRGRDVIYGGAGNDLIKPDKGGGDIVYGGEGDDDIVGRYSKVLGGSGDDDLSGYGCIMKGGAGDDDIEVNGHFTTDEYGHDVWGGSGADNFVFDTGGFQVTGGHETIHDLSNKDHIDLSIIDAYRIAPGNQSFTLVPEFTGQAGQMTIGYDAENDQTLIKLYTDTDMIPDGTIIALGDHTDFMNFTF